MRSRTNDCTCNGRPRLSAMGVPALQPSRLRSPGSLWSTAQAARFACRAPACCPARRPNPSRKHTRTTRAEDVSTFHCTNCTLVQALSENRPSRPCIHQIRRTSRGDGKALPPRRTSALPPTRPRPPDQIPAVKEPPHPPGPATRSAAAMLLHPLTLQPAARCADTAP